MVEDAVCVCYCDVIPVLGVFVGLVTGVESCMRKMKSMFVHRELRDCHLDDTIRPVHREYRI